jgi:DNA-directed RNA polymerase subunit E'/Rpb7
MSEKILENQSENIKITKNIELTPDLIGNHKQELLNILTEFYTGKCFSEYGLVKSVDPSVKIIDNIISRVNCNIIFYVEFSINVIAVSIGKKYVMQVDKINSKHIIGNIEEKISVLLRTETLKNYIFENDCFRRGKNKIDIGTKLFVQIEKVKYKSIDEIMVIVKYCKILY